MPADERGEAVKPRHALPKFIVWSGYVTCVAIALAFVFILIFPGQAWFHAIAGIFMACCMAVSWRALISMASTMAGLVDDVRDRLVEINRVAREDDDASS